MIGFYVNDVYVDYNEVWYHSQKNPHPAGNTYRVIVTLDETIVLGVIEKMVKSLVNDQSFIDKAITHTDSSFNLINYISIGIRKKNKEKKRVTDTKWVFNNIEKVLITENELVIEGVCSLFLKDW